MGEVVLSWSGCLEEGGEEEEGRCGSVEEKRIGGVG